MPVLLLVLTIVITAIAFGLRGFYLATFHPGHIEASLAVFKNRYGYQGLESLMAYAAFALKVSTRVLPYVAGYGYILWMTQGMKLVQEVILFLAIIPVLTGTLVYGLFKVVGGQPAKAV